MNKYILPQVSLKSPLTFVCTNAYAVNSTLNHAEVCTSTPAFSTEEALALSKVIDVNPTGPDFANSVWTFVFSDLSANLSISAICGYRFYSVYGCLPSMPMSTPECRPEEATDFPYCICNRKQSDTPFGVAQDMVVRYNVTIKGKKAHQYCFKLAEPGVRLNTNARCSSTPTLKKLEIHADYSKRFSVMGVSANGGGVKSSWGNNVLPDTTIDYNTFKLTDLAYNKDQVANDGLELCIYLDTSLPLDQFCMKDVNQYSTCAVSLFDVSQQCCPVYLASP